jgi:rubrerythrin
MSNRSKLGPSGRPVSSTARMVRRRCSECGSRGIDWMSAEEAVYRGISIVEYREFLGQVQDVWRCRACGHGGAFGPDEGPW